MFALFLHGLQKLVKSLRALVARRTWQDTACAGVLPNFGIGVEVVFAVLQAGAHVQHLADGGVAKGTVFEFGHIAGHRGVLVQFAFGHQHRAQRAKKGFGHRHRDVLPFRAQGACITLVHDAALVQHHHTVGVVGIKGLSPGHGRVFAQRNKADRIEVVAQGAGQRRWCARATRDLRGRDQLPEIRKTPTRLRKLVARTIGKADHFVRGRRRAHHPAQSDRIGLCGRWQVGRLRQQTGGCGGHGQSHHSASQK